MALRVRPTRPVGVGPSGCSWKPAMRTTATGQGACPTRCSLTDPSPRTEKKARENAPMPRDPTTSRSVP